jgi:hypothetical protein
MKATVVVLNASFQLARARTANDLAFAFRIPSGSAIALSDELEVDLEALGVVQDARNVTTGQPLRLKIDPYNVQDLVLPHGRLQPPALARRRGAPPYGAAERDRKEYRAA